jgi:ZIP family zinc transporter
MLIPFLFSLVAGLIIGITSTFASFLPKPSRRGLSLTLGVSAGVIISIVVWELLPESIEYGNISITLLGVVAGYFLGIVVEKISDHHKCDGHLHDLRKAGMTISYGIAMHNLFDGLAMGVGFEVSTSIGLMVTLAVVLHNLPLGLAIATPLRVADTSIAQTVGIAFTVGLVTPVGTLLGLFFSGLFEGFLSLGLALAAGTMLFIVIHEIFPTSRQYNSVITFIGFFSGFLFMSFISKLT